MDIRQSVIGEVAIRDGNQIRGITLGTLLARLLLFDRVVIKCVGLRELPFLIRAFGKTGFLDLLNSGVLQLSSEFTFIVGAPTVNGVRQLPLFHFDFGIAEGQRQQALDREIRCLQGISGLKNQQRAEVEQAVLSKLVRPPPGSPAGMLTQFKSDLRTNTPALGSALKQELKLKGIESTQNPSIHVEETPNGFHVVNDLCESFGITAEAADNILLRSILSVGHLNERIADMAAYSAITGFADSEVTLLFGKFAGILAPQNPKLIEEQFARVISIANFPDFSETKRIDVQSLMKARESSELREFRNWLYKLDTISDSQVSEMIGGIRNMISSLVQSRTGRALRFAASTAVGLIPPFGLVLGPAASAIDSFLIDRIFPTSGVVAFLTNTYPSLFDSPSD